MNKLKNFLESKCISICDFEDKACKALDDNDHFIPFAKNELMQHYNISSDFENEVSMLLSKILSRQFVFS